MSFVSSAVFGKKFRVPIAHLKSADMRQLTLTKTILALKISAREEYQFEFKVRKRFYISRIIFSLSISLFLNNNNNNFMGNVHLISLHLVIVLFIGFPPRMMWIRLVA